MSIPCESLFQHPARLSAPRSRLSAPGFQLSAFSSRLSAFGFRNLKADCRTLRASHVRPSLDDGSIDVALECFEVLHEHAGKLFRLRIIGALVGPCAAR